MRVAIPSVCIRNKYVSSSMIPVEHCYRQMIGLKGLGNFPMLMVNMERAKQHCMDRGGLSEVA